MKTILTTEHLRNIAPAWPLQSTVAVNPFWNQIDRPFDEVMGRMSSLTHQSLFMPRSYYLEKYKKGEIENSDIESALLNRKSGSKQSSFDLQEFLELSSKQEEASQQVDSFSDFIDRKLGTKWHSVVTYEIAKYASAFFDEGQALARFPWSSLSFYDAWIAAQEFDKSFEMKGIKQFHKTVEQYNNLTPETAMQQIISRLGFSNENAVSMYIGRLSVMNNGWASQFAYHEWRAKLGYLTKENIRSIELIAVQMITDNAIAESFEKSNPGIVAEWVQSFQKGLTEKTAENKAFELNRVWQTALESSRQRQISAQIRARDGVRALPKIQITMCIDVRSEPYRRAIEAVSNDIETVGFAGFFGLPFEYSKLDEKQAGARAPVLLKSAFTVQEEMIKSSPTQRMARTLARSYFRNLRKAPMSSFLFVELFSVPALFKMAARFFQSLNGASQVEIPKKFSDLRTRPNHRTIKLSSESCMTLDAKVKIAAAVLGHMGIRSRFGRLVVIAGHGSDNRNNAFVSASDCGACGGHSGDINSRLLADLLNDQEIRRGLKDLAIEIPITTRFIAAVHETVTDQLYLLDQTLPPDSHTEDVNFLIAAIAKAGHMARQERQIARSNCLDSSPWRRSRSWSEVRSEWALAGNSCFIVAPRSFTKNANFEGRAFLHDYEWQNDKNFETLELIMTAPMLVTNWINLQYYSSTVAPSVYGSGNKVLHNLVNENGVVEGNGGDLRIGLPWQSVHDGENFVHEPIRLSVFIAAPSTEIEKIIKKHPTVANLVENEWLFIFQIDGESGKVSRREKSGVYRHS